VFDAATKKWHEEAWYDTNGVQHRTLDTFKAYAYGTNVSLDWKTGALYQRDTTNFTDNGVACVYSHDFPHLLDQEDSRVSPYALLVEDIEVTPPMLTIPQNAPNPNGAEQFVYSCSARRGQC
jgi:hypothetical protein